ncbi:hypothetical protein JTB14_014666 [Gonioctena quinquepunctata]|nr:hypothetical protein JTB14_014666 [Gonioctena quinquepunctata]
MFKLMLVVFAILTVTSSAPAPVPNPKPKPIPQFFYTNAYSTPYVAAAPGVAYTSTYNAPLGYPAYSQYVAPSVYDGLYAAVPTYGDGVYVV